MLLAAALVAAVAVLVLGLFRRRLLARLAGTIEVSLRLKRPGHGRGWVNGVGLFVDDHLYWYRVFSLSVRPRRTYARRDLVVVRRREPTGAEHRALLDGAIVMECRAGDVPVELAMSRSAVTGFLAWLEARPPGATLPV
jgi:hypothetical protein